MPDKEAVVTYLYFVMQNPNDDHKTLKVKRIAQKIEMGFQSWILKPIFGAESNDSTINLNSFKSECIICYAESTDVIVYPCRHLAVGFECIQSLRNTPKCRECPVCRQPVERFIRINLK